MLSPGVVTECSVTVVTGGGVTVVTAGGVTVVTGGGVTKEGALVGGSSSPGASDMT